MAGVDFSQAFKLSDVFVNSNLNFKLKCLHIFCGDCPCQWDYVPVSATCTVP